MSEWTPEDEAALEKLLAKKSVKVFETKQKIRDLFHTLPEQERDGLARELGYDKKLFDFNKSVGLRGLQDWYKQVTFSGTSTCNCPLSWPDTKPGDVIGWGGTCPVHSPTCGT